MTLLSCVYDEQAPDASQSSEKEDTKKVSKKKKPAWVKLWLDFEGQFFESDFKEGHDKLCLYLGHTTEPLSQLEEICLSADGATGAEDWWDNLMKGQQTSVKTKTAPILKAKHREEGYIWRLLKHLEARVDSLANIENYRVSQRLPNAFQNETLLTGRALLDTLVTLCGRFARKRGQFNSSD